MHPYGGTFGQTGTIHKASRSAGGWFRFRSAPFIQEGWARGSEKGPIAAHDRAGELAAEDDPERVMGNNAEESILQDRTKKSTKGAHEKTARGLRTVQLSFSAGPEQEIWPQQPA